MEVAFYEPGRNVAQSAAQARATEMLVHARALFAEVAKRHQARGEFFEQALALNSIGLAFYYDDAYDEAIAAYQRALEVYEKMGERMRQAQTLQNIGVVQNEMAQFPQAFETYARVLKLLDEAENPKLYADVLNNLALSEYETGRPDSALRHYSEALAIMVRVQSTSEQARSLHGHRRHLLPDRQSRRSAEIFRARTGTALGQVTTPWAESLPCDRRRTPFATQGAGPKRSRAAKRRFASRPCPRNAHESS